MESENPVILNLFQDLKYEEIHSALGELKFASTMEEGVEAVSDGQWCFELQNFMVSLNNSGDP